MTEDTYDLLDELVLYLSELDDDSTEGIDLLGRVISLRTDLMDELGMFEHPGP